MNKINVILYVQRPRFYRVFITLINYIKYNNLLINFLYIIDRNNSSNKFYVNLIDNKNIILDTFNINKLIKYSPQYFITPNVLKKRILKGLSDKLKSTKIIFMTHGLWNLKSVAYTNIARKYWSKYNKYYTYIIINQSIVYNFLKKLNVPKEKIMLMPGSLQIDYILDLKKLNTIHDKKLYYYKKYNIDINKKSILFVQNHRGANVYDDIKITDKFLHIKEYYLILDTLVKYGHKHNYHIFSKIKDTGNGIFSKLYDTKLYNEITLLHNDKSCTLLKTEEELPVYDFFFSDIIVIETGGTTLVEAHLINPKTIQCQISQTHDIFGIDKYPLLPQANTIDELNKLLILFDDPLYKFNKSYKRQQQLFIRDHIGVIKNTKKFLLSILI